MAVSALPLAVWKQALLALVGWILASLVTSLLIGAATNESGVTLILIVMYGIPICISGSIAHVMLIASARFRRAQPLTQVAAISGGAIPILAAAVIALLIDDHRFHLEFVPAFAGLWVLPTIALAALVNWLVRKAV